MVNIRPLIFLNVILLAMFITAGFAPKPLHLVSDSVPKPAKDLNVQASTPKLVSDAKAPDSAPEPKPETKSAANVDTQNAPLIDKNLADADSLNVEFEDAIFADELPDIGFEKHQTDQNSKSIVNVQKEQGPIKTGRLTIRSNVFKDTVLIDGRPYGSTRLDVELTPGTYQVEVAKSGYRSWERAVEIRPGREQTLSALLQAYTSVNYVDGIWQNDVTTGEGTYIEANSIDYRGSFVDGKFHGVGSVRYENGLRYQGDWFQGVKQGEGTLTTAEGDVYVGTMEDDSFNGQGTLTKANGDIYTGYWIDNVLNGQGTLTTSEGLLYVGGFSDNAFHGTGSLTYPDGGHYEGSFSSGLYHGKGIETYANGKRYEGQFVEGLYHGQGEILNPNGSKISGTFKEGEPYGRATLTTAQGEIFSARTSEPGVCYRPKSYRATDCPELEGW